MKASKQFQLGSKPVSFFRETENHMKLYYHTKPWEKTCQWNLTSNCIELFSFVSVNAGKDDA